MLFTNFLHFIDHLQLRIFNALVQRQKESETEETESLDPVRHFLNVRDPLRLDRGPSSNPNEFGSVREKYSAQHLLLSSLKEAKPSF